MTVSPRKMLSPLQLAALLPLWLTWLIGSAVQAAPEFPAFRDLAIYTTSTPDARNAARIIARTQFVNRGEHILRLTARLQPAQSVGFRGATYTTHLRPGTSAVWTWIFTAPEGFTREVLTGDIVLNGRLERDLFIAVEGTDPPGYGETSVVLHSHLRMYHTPLLELYHTQDPPGLGKITERARVVATYAPRNRHSIRAQRAVLAANRPDAVLTLAADGRTDYTVLVSVLPPPPEDGDALAYWRGRQLTASQQELIDALDDLQRVVRLKTGAELLFRARTDGPAIILRWATPGPAAADLHDAYRLRTAGGNVLIEAVSPEGMRNGVYGLLTDHLDCHWFQPRQLGEEIVIPADRTLFLPALDEVRGSVWYSAGGASWGREPLWDRRNRAIINRGRMNYGHAWNGYINASEFPFEQYPAYYARDRAGNIRKTGPEGRYTNFCPTHPEVLDIVARKVNAYFTNNPDRIVASLDPNDYAPMCLCDRCLSLDKEYGQTREDGRAVADRLLHFSRAIYERLHPEHQNKFLGILVYGFQMDLPVSATAHSQYAGLICNMTWRYDHSRPWNDPTSTQNREFHTQLQGWGALLSQLGYYDYYGHIYFFGPWAMVQKLREDLPAFRELGGTFLMLEAQPNFATQGLNHYIASRLIWDIEADVDLALEEFFQVYYGPAADAMYDYWMSAERYYRLERVGGWNPPFAALRPEFWTELADHLQAAQQAVANLPSEQRRYADRVRLASDGFEYGQLLFDYSYRYGGVARRLLQFDPSARPIDHAAAIAYLRKHRGRIEELLATYSSDDPYWPLLKPVYLHGAISNHTMSIDALQQWHEDELQAAQ